MYQIINIDFYYEDFQFQHKSSYLYSQITNKVFSLMMGVSLLRVLFSLTVNKKTPLLLQFTEFRLALAHSDATFHWPRVRAPLAPLPRVKAGPLFYMQPR